MIARLRLGRRPEPREEADDRGGDDDDQADKVQQELQRCLLRERGGARNCLSSSYLSADVRGDETRQSGYPRELHTAIARVGTILDHRLAHALPDKHETLRRDVIVIHQVFSDSQRAALRQA